MQFLGEAVIQMMMEIAVAVYTYSGTWDFFNLFTVSTLVTVRKYLSIVIKIQDPWRMGCDTREYPI